jgi:hypothetical protein
MVIMLAGSAGLWSQQKEMFHFGQKIHHMFHSYSHFVFSIKQDLGLCNTDLLRTVVAFYHELSNKHNQVS